MAEAVAAEKHRQDELAAELAQERAATGVRHQCSGV